MNSADGELWASLPSPLRTRVDELVLRDNEFAAIRALWTSGVEPRPRLIIATLPRTPRMNVICGRVIGTFRRELLDRT
jgi:hypothetical protein